MSISKRYIKRPVISRRVMPVLDYGVISINDNNVEEKSIVDKVEQETKEDIISIEESQIIPEIDSVSIHSNDEEVVDEKKQPKKQRRTKKQKNAEIDENNELKEE